MQAKASSLKYKSAEKPLEFAYYSLAIFVIFVVFVSIYFNYAVTKISTDITQYSQHLNKASQDITVLRSQIVSLSAPGHYMLHSKNIVNETDDVMQIHDITLRTIDEMQLEYNNSAIPEIKKIFLTDVESLKSKTTTIANTNLDIFNALTNQNDSIAHDMMTELESLTRQTLSIFDDVNQNILALRTKHNENKNNETNTLMILHYVLLLLMPVIVVVFALYGGVFSKKLNHLETERKRKTDDLELANQTLQEKSKELQALTDNAERANHAKSVFLTNISREIRLPLTAIIRNCDGMQGGKQSSANNESIYAITKNANYLLHLISNIVDLSKIEANKLEIEQQCTSLFGLLDEIHQHVSFQTQAKGLDFKLDYHFPLPGTINTDPLRYKQIILNLCSNAVRFTHSGKIVLKIFCPPGKQQLSVSVIDSGIGMTDDIKNTIFNTLEQPGKDSSVQYGGTELGLALSKQLVDKLDGQISVETAQGIGSNFTVTIPIGLAQIDYVNQPPSETVSVDNSKPHNETITNPIRDRNDKGKPTLKGLVLLVEDNADNQVLTTRLLEKVGLNVDLAENGKIAVDKAINGHYDLILMDIQMPVMNGLEATAELRKNNYPGKIVAVTANTSDSEKQECFAAGCDDFLAKPIIRDVFYDRLNTYFNSHISSDVNPTIQNEPKTDSDNAPFTSTVLENDPDIIDLLEDYLQRLPAIIQGIKSAYEEKNWVTMQKQAHDLKSTSGLFGLNPLSEIANGIVADLRSDTYNNLSTMVQNMDIISTKIESDVNTQIQHYNKAV